MSRLWSPFVKQLVPYVPGEQPKLSKLVKLNTNENPFPPSPKVAAAMAQVSTDSLRLYPDPDSAALKNAIAQRFALHSNQVFVGNGSDEVLAHIFMALFRHGKPVLYPDISYSFYPVYCGLYEIEGLPVPLREDFSLALEDYPAQAPKGNGGIIFPNPNAPTGMAVSLSEIETLLQHNRDSVVVVDEAYVDFGAQTAASLVDQYDNLLVVQTFSKSRSLAGLRVGFALGQATLIDALERVKNSFNSYPLDRVAQAAAVAAVDDEAYFAECCERIIAARESLVTELQALEFRVLPSKANFVFARHATREAAEVAAALREDGVIVRHFTAPERIRNYLRITVGTAQQHDALLTSLRRLLEK